MDFGEFRTYCLAKSGVTEDYPFDQTHAWLKVMGKLFAISNLDPFTFKGEVVQSFYSINLKCEPERAIQLREEYDFVTPGWHMNKKHWNTVITEHAPEKLLLELIDHSYDLVTSKLTKAQKLELKNLSQ